MKLENTCMLQRMNMKMMLFFLLSFIQCKSSNIYCDPKLNEYYEPKHDHCLLCPKCPRGMESCNIDDWNVKVEYREGPTKCRRCIDCKFGTFSNSPSYKCTICTNCTVIGKAKQAECTRYEDAVCGERLTEYATHLENTTKNINIEDNLNDRNRMDYILVIILSTCCAVVVAAFSLLFFCVHRVKRRRNYRMVFLPVISPANKKKQVPLNPLNQKKEINKNETTMDPKEQNGV